ncbi:MAG TPA: hypothetical protein DEP84_31520 [Chloroflexi bacterium]|nr:hypothetical protein [Chloroflexota bacterium]
MKGVVRVSILPHTTIERLQVRNFRSLHDVDVALGPLTVLVGPNSAGKSTLVDALRFVRDAVTRGLDTALADRGGFSSLHRWTHKGPPHDIHIQLSLRDPAWTAEYGFTLGTAPKGKYRVKRERLKYDEMQPGSHTRPVEIELKEGKLVQASDVDRQVEQWLSLAVSAPQTDFTDRLSLPDVFPLLRITPGLVTFLKNMGFYTIYPDTLRKPQKPGSAYPLDERGDNLATVLRELRRETPGAFDAIKQALSQVVVGIDDLSVQQVGGYLVTRLHHRSEENGKGGPAFELALESDGTLRVLGILTALYQEPARSLVAIEEPELTVHPGALSVLCDALQEASLRSQVIITTHSPDLISRFPIEAIRVVEKEGEATRVGPVEESQYRAVVDKLFLPGELLRIEGLHRQQTSANEK